MTPIQYASDLHITDFPTGTPFENFIIPSAPILVLAGDICSVWDSVFTSFLHWCSRHWNYIIFVPGNHEYYNEEGYTMFESDVRMNYLCKQLNNIVFLQNGASYKIPNSQLRFVGATLWSNITTHIWSEAIVKKGDCNHIFTISPLGPMKLHPGIISATHALHKESIGRVIINIQPETLIVVTHHLPTKQLLESKYVGEKWHTFYASDDDDLFYPHIQLWICGHGHRAASYISPSGVPVVMNARGYNRDEELFRDVDKYNPKALYYV